MSVLRGWGLPEQHLALDALVAFVDGELTPNAYDRAASHLAGCPACAAEATAQRQARSAVRTAETPAMSSRLLQSLQSIPSEAELPAQPDGLALTREGQLVTTDHRGDGARAFGSGPVLGSSTPLGGGARPFGGDSPFGSGAVGVPDHPEQPKGHGRRAKQSASVVFSGIVLGALAFINVPGDEQRETVTTVPGPFPQGDTARSTFTPEDAAFRESTAATTSTRKPAPSTTLPTGHPAHGSSTVSSPAPAVR